MIRALACIVALLSAVPAWAEKRVALVVGNSAYENVTPLDNPRNDARLIAATLAGLGFILVGGGAQLDLNKAGLETAIQDFGKILPGSEVAMFYYAGHGVQLRGSNYLVPVGANPTREADVDFQMIDVASVLRQMEGAAKLNVVVLDACRNNPFGSRGLRSTLGGLAQIQVPEGTLISYATQPGSVALDGAGGNSPYSKALAEIIKKPGLGIFDAFNQVGLLVKKATGGSQQPWVSSSPIDGNFYFAGAAGNTAAATPPPAAAPDPCGAAQAHWTSAESIGTVAAYQDHLRLFARCPFAGLAKARIDEKTKVAAISPQPATTAPRFVPAGVDPANVIVIDSTKGRIVIQLRADLAPHHAERIRQLARDGYYDNVPFHRVIDGFMAQTGDGQNFNGTGGSKYPNLKAEFSSTPYRRGIVGMARRGDSVDSANSQFFFMFGDAPSLNGLYTVIGEVVSGMDVIDRLKKAPPGSPGGAVTDPDKMVKVQVASDIK